MSWHDLGQMPTGTQLQRATHINAKLGLREGAVIQNGSGHNMVENGVLVVMYLVDGPDGTPRWSKQKPPPTLTVVK